MTSAEIRQSFLRFFEERGHAIVPSSPVVPYDDPTLLFTNAGMNQFKDVFLGLGKRSYTRAADTQKCIRVSGKHNDLEEVGRDTYHHTFFEMLGNWSFGDYYKKEAIEWAWDLLTNVWGLTKGRLWATVYEDDEEAEHLWKTVTDIEQSRVLRFGEKDNFWEMGETGPCGPCSEIHIDRTAQGNATASMVNAGIPEVMEIWNLVFIQYDRDAQGKLNPLPAKHVDTGMGFERMCAVLQNKDSNYDTDVFMPSIRRIVEITGKRYDGRLAGIDQKQFETDTAMRVLADHLRALTFAVADGATPSNEGRGYVLRRLLRRAARFARNLGIHEPLLYQLVPTLIQTMGHVFPEIHDKQEHIQKIVRGEEEAFNATLDRGLEIFEQVAARALKGTRTIISGDDVFRLYDTYGFPTDLTALLARERGLAIDTDGFDRLMQQQRERSRLGATGELSGESAEESSPSLLIPGRDILQAFANDIRENKLLFVGYDQLEADATLVKGDRHLLVLDRTPFYGEAGGQVGDQGVIEIDNRRFNVHDTQKVGNLNVHVLKEAAPTIVGERVKAKVDVARRMSIMRNHSATHLLHAALRRILGTHVHQAGSLVAPDYLRFDFSHFSKVSESELADIEALVNEKVREDLKLSHHRDIPFEEAKRMGALMFFGDKYGDHVNVVQFGDFTREFCGGTHVHSTAEIGYFKFRSEASIASGVRRIEAVTADRALELLKLQDRSASERLNYALEQLQELHQLAIQLAVNRSQPISNFENTLKILEAAISNHQQTPRLPESYAQDLRPHFEERKTRELFIESLILDIADKKKTVERELSKNRMEAQASAIDDIVASAKVVEDVKVVSSQVTVQTIDELKLLGDTLRSRLGRGVGLLAATIDSKVSLVCVVTDDLVGSKTLDAAKIVGAVAKLLGGGGGGKAHLATAGGKDASKLPQALAATESIVQSMLKGR